MNIENSLHCEIGKFLYYEFSIEDLHGCQSGLCVALFGEILKTKDRFDVLGCLIQHDVCKQQRTFRLLSIEIRKS